MQKEMVVMCLVGMGILAWKPTKVNTERVIRETRKRILQEVDSLFESFKKEFDVEYSAEEEPVRRKIFERELAKIQAHNSEPNEFKMGLNEFSAMTPKEFNARYLEAPQRILDPSEVEKDPLPSVSQARPTRLLQSGREDPQSILRRLSRKVDWTQKGKVSPVKHQGTCQACYVFSAVGALESAISMKFNVTVQLSEQEILDCSYSFRNNGCVGGQPQFVYDYVLSNGLNLMDNYPYKAVPETCKAPTYKNVFKKKFRYFKPELNIFALLEYLQFGPVVVNHYVPDTFKYYYSGLFITNECAFETIINHSAIIVGYDLTAARPFFLLKNSWGLKWGEQGFYKVLIGDLTYDNPGFCHLASNGYNIFPTYF